MPRAKVAINITASATTTTATPRNPNPTENAAPAIAAAMTNAQTGNGKTAPAGKGPSNDRPTWRPSEAPNTTPKITSTAPNIRDEPASRCPNANSSTATTNENAGINNNSEATVARTGAVSHPNAAKSTCANATAAKAPKKATTGANTRAALGFRPTHHITPPTTKPVNNASTASKPRPPINTVMAAAATPQAGTDNNLRLAEGGCSSAITSSSASPAVSLPLRDLRTTSSSPELPPKLSDPGLARITCTC